MPKKKFTVMFYFASDNPLAASIVSQLKSIKNAGYHPEVNVIAQFDPNTDGTPTHIFEVNLVEKLRNPGKPNIGFADDEPFVRNLLEDKLWGDQKGRGPERTPIKDKLADVLRRKFPEPIDFNPPPPPDGLQPLSKTNGTAGNGNGTAEGNHQPAKTDGGPRVEASPQVSLHEFLKFCATTEEYKADHYLLFILGHGVVVGNDIFLFDENAPQRSLTLTQLHLELDTFRRLLDAGSSFDLVGFHSCSVSSLEVAYQLQGTADYMLASQGPAFVGSWPYRQILIRIFKEAERGRALTEGDVRRMLERIFNYCYHNSTDFLLAGYSYDIALCDLRNIREKVRGPLQTLSDALVSGLKSEDEAVREAVMDAVLLAHWKSQSYWRENYTDLFDFCFRLRKQFEPFAKRMSEVKEGAEPSEEMEETEPSEEMEDIEIIKAMVNIEAACLSVETQLTEGGPVIVRSGIAGPAYQYSRGLSVFFPWAEPTSDSHLWRRNAEGKVVGHYRDYEFAETGWIDFLDAYFRTTLRHTRREEEQDNSLTSLEEERRLGRILTRGRSRGLSEEELLVLIRDERELIEDIASLVYNREGELSSESALAGPPGKTSPEDGTGDGDSGVVIKNFPRDTRVRNDRGRLADGRSAPVSKTFALRHEEEDQPAPPVPVN